MAGMNFNIGGKYGSLGLNFRLGKHGLEFNPPDGTVEGDEGTEVIKWKKKDGKYHIYQFGGKSMLPMENRTPEESAMDELSNLYNDSPAAQNETYSKGNQFINDSTPY